MIELTLRAESNFVALKCRQNINPNFITPELTIQVFSVKFYLYSKTLQTIDQIQIFIISSNG